MAVDLPVRIVVVVVVVVDAVDVDIVDVDDDDDDDDDDDEGDRHDDGLVRHHVGDREQNEKEEKKGTANRLNHWTTN